jgi:hypothetical protein
MAAMLFAIMATTLSSVWVLHARTQQKTGQLLVAADLADNEMSRVLSLGYHAIGPSSTTYAQTWTVRDQVIEHEFQCQTIVVPITFIQVKFIRVLVRYSDGSPDGQPAEYVVDSFVASEEV